NSSKIRPVVAVCKLYQGFVSCQGHIFFETASQSRQGSSRSEKTSVNLYPASLRSPHHPVYILNRNYWYALFFHRNRQHLIRCQECPECSDRRHMLPVRQPSDHGLQLPGYS